MSSRVSVGRVPKGNETRTPKNVPLQAPRCITRMWPLCYLTRYKGSAKPKGTPQTLHPKP